MYQVSVLELFILGLAIRSLYRSRPHVSFTVLPRAMTLVSFYIHFSTTGGSSPQISLDPHGR